MHIIFKHIVFILNITPFYLKKWYANGNTKCLCFIFLNKLHKKNEFFVLIFFFYVRTLKFGM